MRSEKESEIGISLLEMLVTLALFSLMLSIFGVVFNRLNHASTTVGRLEGNESIEVVSRFLQQTLEEMRPYTYREQNQVKRLLFDGALSSVRFVGVSSAYDEIGGLYDTEIELNDQGQLRLRRRPLGWGSDPPVISEILFSNVADVRFSYAPCPTKRRDAQTHRWSDPAHLPYLITIEVSFEPPGRRNSLTLVAFIASASCPVGP